MNACLNTKVTVDDNYTFGYGLYINRQKDEHNVGSDISASAAAATSGHSGVVKAAVSTSDVIQEAEKCTERSRVVCTGHGKQDHVIIFTRRLFTQLYT